MRRSAGAPSDRERTLIVLGGLALVACAAHLWRYRGALLDDAFTSFRYARNLTEGAGLVYNVGERVEGYSNLLFVLFSALAQALGLDPARVAKAISLAAAAAVVGLLASLERRWVSGRRWVPVSWLLVLPLPAFAYWAVGTLEAMLFTCLLLWGIARLGREMDEGRGRGAALPFALLVLLRPEGAFCFAVAAGAFLLVEWRERGTLGHVRRHVAGGVVVAAVLAALLAWRWWYYGALVPNTFRAKVTGGPEQVLTGLLYLRRWVAGMPVLAAAALLAPALAWPAVRRRLGAAPALEAVAIIAFVLTAYAVLVGGDSMPFFRFFLPVVPLAALLAAAVLAALARPAVVALVCVAGVAASLATEEPYRAFVAHRTTLVGLEVGRFFAGHLPPDALVAVNTAGSLPFASRLPTLDMLGLTDETIARRPVYIVSAGWAGHRRGWGRYVLERRPRVILWYNSAGARAPFYLGDRELADDPYFRFFYVARSATLPVGARAGHGVVERFLGEPFGPVPPGGGSAGELGLRVEMRSDPMRMTEFIEGPVRLEYFELDARDRTLWPLREAHRRDVGAFLAAVAARWQAERAGEAGGDPAAQVHVERLCARAYAAIRAGDLRRAKALLAAAARRNGAARSPLVYQYVANVAVLTGDLPVAIGAQKAALRLAPANERYRQNLLSLLTVPWEQGSRPQRRAPD